MCAFRKCWEAAGTASLPQGCSEQEPTFPPALFGTHSPAGDSQLLQTQGCFLPTEEDLCPQGVSAPAVTHLEAFNNGWGLEELSGAFPLPAEQRGPWKETLEVTHARLRVSQERSGDPTQLPVLSPCPNASQQLSSSASSFGKHFFIFIYLNLNFRAANTARPLPKELQLRSAHGEGRGQTSQATCRVCPCHPNMARKVPLLTQLPLLAWHKVPSAQKSAQGWLRALQVIEGHTAAPELLRSWLCSGTVQVMWQCLW